MSRTLHQGAKRLLNQRSSRDSSRALAAEERPHSATLLGGSGPSPRSVACGATGRRSRCCSSRLSLPAPLQVEEQLAEKLEEEKWQKVEEAKKLNRYLLERQKLEAPEQLDIQLERPSWSTSQPLAGRKRKMKEETDDFIASFLLIFPILPLCRHVALPSADPRSQAFWSAWAERQLSW